MKKLILLPLLLLIGWQSYGVVAVDADWAAVLKNSEEVNLNPEMFDLGMEEFLNLTPKKFRQKTGKRLGLKKSMQLKMAQKMVKKQFKKADPEIDKGLYIVLCIFAFAWIAMGVMDDWDGKNWVTNLILSLLCGLPGMIHGLIKMKDYY